MRTLLLMIVALVAGAAGLYFGQQYLPAEWRPKSNEGSGDQKERPKPSTTAAAREGNVTAYARLEPESEIIGVGGPAGSRIIRYAEADGKPLAEDSVVKKGDPLVYLDSNAEMAAALKHAEAMLDEATKSRDAETAFGNANITVANQKIHEAEDVAPLGIKAQEAEVRRCEAELKKLRLDEGRSSKMLADRAIPQSTHDGAVLLVSQAEEQLARNRAMLEQMKEDKRVKLDMAKAQLESARAGKTRGEQMAQVEALRQGVELAKARLERTIIRAPISGEIIKINTKEGESIGPAPILKLANVTQMVAVAEIYETDRRQVQPGQKAKITSKALSKELTGTVERINKLIHKNDVLRVDPTAAADARVIEARIKLDDPSEAKDFIYLQVDVQIEIGK